MKNIIRKSLGAILLTGTLITANTAFAQPVVNETVTTTTSTGTISKFDPETIIIRSETSPEPIRYSYSKTTTYVDENGAPVSVETVKSGQPVTVYYTKVGDKMVASKVIVKQAATDPATPGVRVEQRDTTTTTTETSK